MPVDQGTSVPRPPDRLSGGTATPAAVEASRGAVLRPGCHLLRLDAEGDRTAHRAAVTARSVSSAEVRARSPAAISTSKRRAPIRAPAMPVFARACYRDYLRVTRARPRRLDARLRALRLRPHVEHVVEKASSSRLRGTGTRTGGLSEPDDFLRGEVRDPSGGRGRRPDDRLGLTAPAPRGDRARSDGRAARARSSARPGSAGQSSSRRSAGTRGRGERRRRLRAEWRVMVDRRAARCDACRRSGTNLDEEWRFWLVVRASPRRRRPRRHVRSRPAPDSNNVPREAAGIASRLDDSRRGSLGRRQRACGSAPCPTCTFARRCTRSAMRWGCTRHPGQRDHVPDARTSLAGPSRRSSSRENVEWSYADKDVLRLCHMPDHWVRPGGVPFGPAFGTAPRLPDSSDAEPDRLELSVSPLLADGPDRRAGAD